MSIAEPIDVLIERIRVPVSFGRGKTVPPVHDLFHLVWSHARVNLPQLLNARCTTYQEEERGKGNWCSSHLMILL